MRILLASKSPRRKELLSIAGINFEIVESDLDESQVASNSPELLASKLAELKAHGVAEKNKDALVIGADTIVVCDQQDAKLGVLCGNSLVLGKPKDKDEARAMIMILSDSQHKVITAFSLISINKNIKIIKHVETKVSFRKINQDELEKYIESDEPYDKAGGYGAQGYAQSFISTIEGSYTNVVGLPLAEVITELRTVFEKV